MLDIKKIIVPVDLHQHTEDLAQFAIDVANKLGATPIFLHIVENFAIAASYGDAATASFAQLEEDMFGQAKRKMADLVTKYKTTCPECTSQILRGDAADAIVEYAQKENSIGLIVMATHGTQGIEKLMLGSVAERVLKRAHCPVLVFNPYKGERGYKITQSIADTVQPV